MGLGTKNRLAQTAATCKAHLRAQYAGKIGLVEEFIAEIEGREEDAAQWSRFTDAKRSTAEMLGRVEAAFERWLNP
jgi:hypothetical protein